MRTVKMSELNQQTSAVLRLVREDGETLIITDRGEQVARITPIRKSLYEEFVSSGQLKPASRRRVPAVPREENPSTEASDALTDLRRDRL